MHPALDALTGLMTGAEFERRIGAAVRSLRPAESLCVCYVRLDRFRHINRRLGFSAGDSALQICAERLLGIGWAEGPANVSLAARMGGDEFAVAITLPSGSFTDALIQRLVVALRQPLALGPGTAYLTASVGYQILDASREDARGVLQSVAMAASRARRSGGNTLARACGSEASGSGSTYALIEDLRLALSRAEIQIRFQPQVDRQCRLDGFEVLAAWNHPRLGAVDADLFVRLAEESGLILELGEWVLRQACLQLAYWRRCGFTCPKIAVNVSPLQFASPEFVGRVHAILEESGIPGHCLEFEITEKAVLRDIEESAARMRELRQCGISFAIDDFGVGYSPLTYLHRLPVDTVKVDRTFIGEIAKNGGSLPLVHTISVLAHQRGMKVVAEGVETKSELELVRAARCDRMQGFLFGCALPAPEVEQMLQGSEPLGPAGDPPLEDRLY